MSDQLFRRRTLVMHGLMEAMPGLGTFGGAWNAIKGGVRRLGGAMAQSGFKGASESLTGAGADAGAVKTAMKSSRSKPWGDVTKAAGFGAEGSKLGADAAPNPVVSRLKMGLGRQIVKRPGLATGIAGGGLLGAGAMGHKMFGGRRDRGY